MSPSAVALPALCKLWFVLLVTLPISVLADPVRVEISGVNEEEKVNILSLLTFNQSVISEDRKFAIPGINQAPQLNLSEQQIRRAHKLAPNEIRQALQPFGYYMPKVSSRLDKREGTWYARYTIDPGIAATIETLQITVTGEGADSAPVQAALAGSTLRQGEQLFHQKYEDIKNSLLQSATDAGYLNAKMTTSEIRIAPDLDKADVVIALDTGPLFYFGQVTINQQALRPNLLEKYVPFSEGDPFNASMLIKMQLALEDTGYFSEIDIQANKSEATAQNIPVTVNTTLEKSRQYTASAGYGTDTGPRANLGVIFRRVNRRGHRLRANLQGSSLGYGFHSQYQVPINNSSTDMLSFNGRVVNEEFGDVESDVSALGISRNEKWLGFRRQIYANFEHERFDLGNGFQSSNLVIPGITLIRQVSDDPVFPRKGYSVSLDLHGAAQNIGSDTSFVRGLITARGVWPIGKRGRLLTRFNYGATEVDDFALIPPSQRFFAGGDRSVRGFGYQDLSPRNEAGARVGGRYLTTLSVELDYLLYRDFGIAVFVDAGNVSDEATPDLRESAGMGLRYRSPIGMIRLDIARPLDDGDETVRLHVSIGADL